MPRYMLTVLWTVGLALVATNLLVFMRARDQARRTATTGPVTVRQRWYELSAEQRQLLAERYNGLVPREDARTVLLQARQFAQLPPERQAALRRLYVLLEQTLERQPPARRHDLRRYPSSARAYIVYETLAAEDPQALADLARQLRESR